MRRLCTIALLACCTMVGAVIIDRIAIVVGGQPVKDSDIQQEVRVTDFLNGDPLDLSQQARKTAANRLIDQALIRHEVQVARYPEATPEEVNELLTQIRKQRGNLSSTLKRYGISEDQLRRHLAWQVTVLHFIEQRFKPGILVNDEDVQQYFEQHKSEFQKTSAQPVTLNQTVRDKIDTQITGERVNQAFYSWLDETRKSANIRYLEADLK